MSISPRESIYDLLAEARHLLHRLEPQEALAAMRHGALLIDTRSRDEVQRTGGVPGALHFRLSVLEWRVDPASEGRDPRVGDLDSRLILMCAQGYSSSLAARRLQQLGFRATTDVIGGFEAWKAAGLPVLPPDPE